jgi:PKD repeat protein
VFQVELGMKNFRYVLFGLILIITAGTCSAATVYVESVQMEGSGSEADVTLYLEGSSSGFSGYDLTISLDNPAVADIIAVSFPPWAGLQEHSPLPAMNVSLRAADLSCDTTNESLIPLATLTLLAHTCGNSGLLITVVSLDDEQGDLISPLTIQNGTISSGVVPPLSPAFTILPRKGSAPLIVEFTDQSEGIITSYYWDFGDGDYATVKNPIHTYSIPGSYQVYLTVYDDQGSAMTGDIIEVTEGPLTIVKNLGNGWNIISTPVLLDASHDDFFSIFPPTSRPAVEVILGWEDGHWFIPEPDYRLLPLHAVLVRIDGTAEARFVPSTSMSNPPARNLPSGISLIGPSPAYTGEEFLPTSVDDALITIEYAQGGLTGYTLVVSPAYNQPSWVYPRNGTPRDLLPFRGYWIIMENPDTYYGFSTTPIQ